jgi:hypothetical protein
VFVVRFRLFAFAFYGFDYYLRFRVAVVGFRLLPAFLHPSLPAFTLLLLFRVFRWFHGSLVAFPFVLVAVRLVVWFCSFPLPFRVLF